MNRGKWPSYFNLSTRLHSRDSRDMGGWVTTLGFDPPRNVITLTLSWVRPGRRPSSSPCHVPCHAMMMMGLDGRSIRVPLVLGRLKSRQPCPPQRVPFVCLLGQGVAGIWSTKLLTCVSCSKGWDAMLRTFVVSSSRPAP